jgi:hypothetical protein
MHQSHPVALAYSWHTEAPGDVPGALFISRIPFTKPNKESRRADSNR